MKWRLLPVLPPVYMNLPFGTVGSALCANLRLGGVMLGLALASQPAQGQGFDYPDFLSTSGLGLQGSARQEGSAIFLAGNVPAQAGGVWCGNRVFVADGFETVFRFRISGRGGGAGLAFVLQNNAVPALSSAADGLGYDGVPNSLAVEFDVRRDAARNDPNENHLSVQARTGLANSADHASSLGTTSAGLPDLADGSVHTARIVLDDGLLRVFVDDLANVVLTVALSAAELAGMLNLDDGQAWIGFSATTAEAAENQEILSWAFSPAQRPMSLNLVSPADGASYLTPGPVILEAGVTSPTQVTRVIFYQGRTLLGEATNSPYLFSWKNVTPGSYQVTARVTDDAGRTTVSAPIGVVVLPLTPPIGINFSVGTGGTNYLLAYSDLAGVVAQRLWNNLSSAASGSAYNLRTGAGTPTTLDVSWNFPGSADEPTLNALLSPDHSLMKAYLAAEGPPGSGVVTLDQIPFPIYDLLVYSDARNDAADRVAEIRVATNSVFLRDAPWAAFSGAYIEARGTTDQGPLTPAGNIVRFNSLTNSRLTLTVAARSSTSGPAGVAVNALQIVPSVDTTTPLALTRGPYLQVGTPSSMVVRWRTSRPSESRVRYGTSLATLTMTNDDARATTEHVVRLQGLTPDRRYYYAVGTSETNLAGPPDCHFVTAPVTPNNTRVWVLGDSGTANANARAVRDGYYQLAQDEERTADLWLMLGDNAYDRGTDREYQLAVFDMYPTTLRQAVLWPTIGNHETSQSHTHNAGIPYYQIFSFPTAGEAGGVPSGTPQYYSFDHGPIHFVCLDSMTSSRTTNGAMYAWLAADLAQHTNHWLIAYWHHPPYTKGSHDSDNDGADFELGEMRRVFLPLLESYGADLVLSGHSHCYERSYLLHGHYGYSSSLRPEMIKDPGSGRPEETGAYRKNVAGPAAGVGTVYAVVGSSGQATFGTMDHPAMFVSYLQLGSMVLDVDATTLRARWVRETGAVQDSFTMIKETAVELRVTALRLRTDQVTVTWRSVPGTSYTVWRRPQAARGAWQPVATGIAATDELTTFSYKVDPAETTGFYRIQAETN